MRLFLIFISIFFITVNTAIAQTFNINPIKDQTVTYPNELLLAFQIEGDVPISEVTFSYQSGIDEAIIRGQSIYWKPEMSDAGAHQIKIIAIAPNGQTASETFTVRVRPFNAPPRFIPVRRITIPVGLPYSLPVTAFDPDGMNRNLIRYLGVNLPQGAGVNEQTGEFTWTPTAKYTGENTFRIIATDQYGAASSIDITIRVVQIPPNSE